MFFLLVYTGHISIIWLHRDWSKFSLFFFNETDSYATFTYANSAQRHGGKKKKKCKKTEGKVFSQLTWVEPELHSKNFGLRHPFWKGKRSPKWWSLWREGSEVGIKTCCQNRKMRERDNLERKCCRKGTFRAESLKGQYESNEVRGQM